MPANADHFECDSMAIPATTHKYASVHYYGPSSCRAHQLGRLLIHDRTRKGWSSYTIMSSPACTHKQHTHISSSAILLILPIARCPLHCYPTLSPHLQTTFYNLQLTAYIHGNPDSFPFSANPFSFPVSLPYGIVVEPPV